VNNGTPETLHCGAVLRAYRIWLSTNAERVGLALAHKGIEVEWVEVPDEDRSQVLEVSGQPNVPVLVHDDLVVTDSPRILAYLEATWPDPPLYPRDPARRAEVETFVDWFNFVWKVPPNAIEAELGRPGPNRERIAEWEEEVRASRDRFEALLEDRDHLFGEFGVADCVAFPFLRFALFHEEGDPYLFHDILVEHLDLGDGYPNLRGWLERMKDRPGALPSMPRR
jgi:maleylpyruvate isomerase